MKFPRNTRLLRSPFDVAPFAAVFFLLVIFLMLAALLPTPGISLQLPSADNLSGTDKPRLALAVTSDGRYFLANQTVNETELKLRLSLAVKNSNEPLTLVVHADKSLTYDQLMHLTLLARDAGIYNFLFATLPRVVNSSAQP